MESNSERIREKQLGIIGGLVMVWAYIENSIDGWIEVIHMTGGSQRIQAHLPASLDRELDYLKVAWKTEKVTRSLKAEGARLLKEIHRLKTFRHNFVHGLVDLNNADAMICHLWKVKGSTRIELKTPYSDAALIEQIKAIAALHQSLSAFVIDFAHFKADLIKGGS